MAYGWLNVTWLMGYTAGPLLGGFLADVFGMRTPFLACFALSVICFPFTLLLRETRKDISFKQAHNNGDEPNVTSFLSVILAFSLINIAQGVGTGIFFPITPIFTITRFSVDLTFVGLLIAIGFGLASVVVQIPGGWWAERYDRRKLLIITFLLSAPFYGLFALSRNLIELFLFMFLSNAILNISWPAFHALMMDLTPPEKWGFMNGISATTFWAGMMIGSAVSGLLWDTFGMFIPYYVSAVAMFLSVIPALFLREPNSSL